MSDDNIVSLQPKLEAKKVHLGQTKTSGSMPAIWLRSYRECASRRELTEIARVSGCGARSRSGACVRVLWRK